MISNPLQSAGTEVLCNDSRGRKHDTQYEKVKWQPNIETNGDSRQIFVTKTGRHDGIDNARTHLCCLSNKQRPSNTPKMA